VKSLALAVVLACACSAPDGVVLWHAYNGDERAALEATARDWNARHADRPLVLVAVPYDAFADKLSSAIPRGNGPDLFIYPQDRIGDWADAGAIEPIEFWVDDARADRFTPEAVAAMAYGSSLYGLPMTVKSLALYYRTDLVASAPRTTDELLALAPAMRAKGGFALAYANVDLYGHAPWLHGFGGRIMDDSGALAIATPQAARAMTFARELVANGVVPADAQGPLVASLFNEGKAATVMSGPWFIADINPQVPWRVTTLPIVSATGRPAAPFASAEGILMSARARDKDAAFAVMDFLTGDASAIARAKLAHQVVPNVHAYDDREVAKDTALGAFRAQLAHVVPMPKGAAMRMVWTPYRTALGEVLAGRAEAAARLIAVEREVAGYAERK
jgi:arabinogalactan oligomer/maltooligosaccharide transport system substrate-binding protein